MILLVGLFVRLALLIVNQEIAVLPQGGHDAIAFERKAWHHAQHGRDDLSDYLVSSADFIVLPASYIYSVTGREPYVLGLLMVILGVGVIYLTYRASLELWGHKRSARIAAWAAALFPQLALHSALFLREIPVSFCLAAAALCAIRYFKRADLKQVVWFSLWVSVGSLFHSGVIVAVPALLAGMLVARPRGHQGRFRFYATNALAAVVLVGFMYSVNQTGFGLGKFGGSIDDAMATFEQQEMRDTTGGAAFPEWMRVRGGVSDAWKIPIRFCALVFAPLLPPMVRSPHHALGVLDAAIYLFLFWLIYRNWKTIRGNRAVVVLLVVMVSLFFVYALGVANFGTAIRHRAKMAPILLIIAACLPELRRHWARTRDDGLPHVSVYAVSPSQPGRGLSRSA